MASAGIFGFILFILSALCFSDMSEDCTNSVVYDGILTLMLLGAIITTMAICYGICVSNRGCYFDADEGNFTETYIGLITLVCFGVVVTALAIGGTMPKFPECTGNMDGMTSSQQEAGKRVKIYVWFMFAMGLVGTLAGAGITYYSLYLYPKQLI